MSVGCDWFISFLTNRFLRVRALPPCRPKIDITIKDALGRDFQCATIQLDFQQPLRFGLEYTPAEKNADGSPSRPVIIHRAILGSVERMLAILIENYNGKWPFWLCPRQACVIPTHPDYNDYALEVCNYFKTQGFMVDVDTDDGCKMEKKIAKAVSQDYSYLMVVGGKERDAKTVAVRGHGACSPRRLRALSACLKRTELLALPSPSATRRSLTVGAGASLWLLRLSSRCRTLARRCARPLHRPESQQNGRLEHAWGRTRRGTQASRRRRRRWRRRVRAPRWARRRIRGAMFRATRRVAQHALFATPPNPFFGSKLERLVFLILSLTFHVTLTKIKNADDLGVRTPVFTMREWCNRAAYHQQQSLPSRGCSSML